MLTRVRTSTISGLDAVPVEVEAEIRSGRPQFSIIGLADSAVRESRERVLSALKHSGFIVPDQILINLAPAELKKEGAAFDLPIAIAILCASSQLRVPDLNSVLFHGELSLDGRLKPIRGALAFATEARQRGVAALITPLANAHEAALISGVEVFGARCLRDVAEHFRDTLLARVMPEAHTASIQQDKSLSEVWGQDAAKRALLIAASGGHNVIMVGPPGCGKSMLAERFPSILPPLTEQEMLEAVRVHSVAGLDTSRLLARRRPFRTPHHGISDAGLIGGGSVPRPGEISFAHHGVLFLDEFPEFRRSALEALRAPLEAGVAHVTRVKGSMALPARFQLLAAMNPCPCGRLGMTQNPCACSRPAILSYLRKLSQPILDRIDLHIELTPVAPSEMQATARDSIVQRENALRTQVVAVRALQLERQGRVNALLPGQELLAGLKPAAEESRLLERACERRGLSARGYVRVLRVARTIADIEKSPSIQSRHIAEALSYRSLERIEKFCLAA